MVESVFLLIGGLSAALAVLLGGLRAHVLPARLDAGRLAMLDVGTRYQLMHATALIIVAALLTGERDAVLLTLAGWGFVLGTLAFPGMMYIYAFTGRRVCLRLSMVGGVLFVGGWVCLAAGAVI